MSFNLFGDLAADLALADRAVHGWFPDTPGRVSELRFVHSPGWFDPAYVNSLRSFDTAFILDLDDGSRGIVAVDVKYHERNEPETPRPDNLMSAMSGAIRTAPRAVNGAARRPSADTPRLTVLAGEANSTPTASPGPTGRGWLDGADEPHRPRMLDWLTGSPTLHPNLFDEAVVLLVDEDIKTAS